MCFGTITEVFRYGHACACGSVLTRLHNQFGSFTVFRNNKTSVQKLKSIFFQIVLIRLNKCFGMLRDRDVYAVGTFTCYSTYTQVLLYNITSHKYTRLVRYVYTNVLVRFKCVLVHLRICLG